MTFLSVSRSGLEGKDGIAETTFAARETGEGAADCGRGEVEVGAGAGLEAEASTGLIEGPAAEAASTTSEDSCISTSPSASVVGDVCCAGRTRGPVGGGGGGGREGDFKGGSTCLFCGGVLVGDLVRDRLGGDGVRLRVGSGLFLRGGETGE